MRYSLFWSLMALFIVLFFAHGENTEMPAADAKELWNYITKTSPYSKWEFWDGHEGMQPGNAPHGPYHKVFVNKTLKNASQVPVPYGSIQVKESFDENKQMMALTVMYKIRGYNPSAGDWFWVKYSVQGTAGPFGKVQGCIGCHSAKADNDYIIVHSIT